MVFGIRLDRFGKKNRDGRRFGNLKIWSFINKKNDKEVGLNERFGISSVGCRKCSMKR